MTMRPRNSTLVLLGLFLAVLALYVLYSPPQVTAGTPQAPQPTQGHTPDPSTVPATPSPKPTRSPRPTRSATPSRSPSPSGTATPGITVSPTSPATGTSLPAVSGSGPA